MEKKDIKSSPSKSVKTCDGFSGVLKANKKNVQSSFSGIVKENNPPKPPEKK